MKPSVLVCWGWNFLCYWKEMQGWCTSWRGEGRGALGSAARVPRRVR